MRCFILLFFLFLERACRTTFTLRQAQCERFVIILSTVSYIEQFGEDKQDWLKKWIPLENVVPSHDCIARVISRLLPSQMTDCFITWTQNVAQITEGEVISLDGKTARHSYNRKDNLGAIHYG
jgi:hypothetical protein